MHSTNLHFNNEKPYHNRVSKNDNEEIIMKSLTGKYKHYCPDWDYMAIDENSIEFSSCTCEQLNTKKGKAVIEIDIGTEFNSTDYFEG